MHITYFVLYHKIVMFQGLLSHRGWPKLSFWHKCRFINSIRFCCRRMFYHYDKFYGNYLLFLTFEIFFLNFKLKCNRIFAAFLTSLFTYFRFVNAFVTEDELDDVDCQYRRCIKYQLKSFHPKEVHLKRVPFVLTIM